MSPTMTPTMTSAPAKVPAKPASPAIASPVRPAIEPVRPVVPARPAVPVLRDGDRMDAAEFVRRWEALPEPRPRAELLDGKVHFNTMSISEARHAVPQSDMIYLLMTYMLATPGTRACAPASLRLGWRNMPEPDAYLRVLETHGGLSHRAEDGFVDGPAELVVEVAAATVARDTGLKFGIYRRNGVLEYLVWRTEGGVLDWYVRREDRFDPLPPADDGVFRSEAFPGLWVDGEALRRGDLPAAVRTLQQGLASPEHAAFVERLRTTAETYAAAAAPTVPADPVSTPPADETA